MEDHDPDTLGRMPAAAALAGLPISEGRSGITGDSCPSPAAALMNLLPLAGANPRPPIGGAYIGEGMPPIPARLATKIRQWEFVEMGELLPEFWARQKDNEEGRDRGARQSRKVTEVLTWVQCYSSFVAVLAPSEPQAVPELMAYQNLIVRASQDYEGLGWVRYDSAFRRQAALTGNKKWSVINSTLYAMNFSARKVGTRRCELCFATSHAEQDCAQRGSADPGVSDRLRYLESAVIAMVRPGAGKPTGGTYQPQAAGEEVCRKWNTGSCNYPRCRFRHACSGCGGNHPLTHCVSHKPQVRRERRPY